MNAHSEHDRSGDVEDRLGRLGRHPVDPDVRAAHLRRAGAVAAAPARRRFGPLAVGAAAVVGFLAGSAGLAAAGALPDPAQNVAHDVLGVVQVDVPQGDNRGACISEAAKIKDKDAKRAAKDACPKGNDTDDDTDDSGPDDAPGRSGDAPGRSGDAPGRSGDAPGRSGDAPGRSGDAPGRSGDAPGQVKHADDPCRGKPPWAGPMPQSEREALKEQHSRDACPDDDDRAADDEDPAGDD